MTIEVGFLFCSLSGASSSEESESESESESEMEMETESHARNSIILQDLKRRRRLGFDFCLISFKIERPERAVQQNRDAGTVREPRRVESESESKSKSESG